MKSLKKLILTAAVIAPALSLSAYKPLDTHIHTPWAAEVTPENV